MDRNAVWAIEHAYQLGVALRKESVDRNDTRRFQSVYKSRVALRKESVDRNGCFGRFAVDPTRSLSARRAWIEMSICVCWMALNHVALRKESVDRNIIMQKINIVNKMSLSARRAWIEMQLIPLEGPTTTVSLSARRAWIEILNSSKLQRSIDSRSPQGERG